MPTNNAKPSKLYPIIYRTVQRFYPKMQVVGMENLPDVPVVLVGNHCQIHGPIACQLYLPEHIYTWCAGEMMDSKTVPAYAYQDFWSQKPAWSHPFYKYIAHIIAPLSAVIFNNARTIPVYRDQRILKTFRQTISHLENGHSVVIFPEHDVPHNQILSDFQEGFVDVARLYYKRTGKSLSFVPMYIAPNLKTMYLGQPISFSPEAPIEEERRRLCDTLMDAITQLAVALPPHTVVPYRNIPKKDYPTNRQEAAL